MKNGFSAEILLTPSLSTGVGRKVPRGLTRGHTRSPSTVLGGFIGFGSVPFARYDLVHFSSSFGRDLISVPGGGKSV